MKTEMVKEMNQYLADMGTMYIKLHNLHWNVIGRDFKQVHEYLETLYEGFADAYDEVAESLKKHGEQPLASMKEYLAVTSIPELPSEELYSSKVLEIVKEDLSSMKAQAEKLRKEADEESLYDVVSMLEDQLSDYSKTLWFISAMMK